MAKAKKPTKTIGASGTAIWGGYIQENERNSALIGSEKYKTYSNILANTSIVAAGTRYFLNLISNAGWSVEPADDSPQAKEMAEQVELIKDQMNMPWRRVVRKAATYKFYGFSVQEWTAIRMDSGVIGIKRIDARPQSTIERWMRDDVGDIETVIQRSPQTFNDIELPRGKLIYIVDDALNDSPEGLGLFRHLAEPARRLHRFEQLEGYGFETDLRGIPVGRAPFAELQKLVDDGALTAAQKLAIEKPLTDFITNHIKSPSLGLLLDSITYQDESDAGTPSAIKQWDMELLKAGSTSQAEVANTIRRLNEEMARVLNMEGLLLGSTNGTQALSVDKSANLAMVVESTQKEMAESFDSDFIGVIGALNGWDKDLLPTFRPDPVRFKDVTEITKAISDLASAGAILTVDDPIIDSVRELLSMPKQQTLDLGMNASLLGDKDKKDGDVEIDEE